ncbi:unnamed protein product [Callosobruchus maculatus]|uniref:Uncharacterized protein n=1 Tax=Callosobruchus maculatus TaxID=64391 RepID=A0A653CXN8_CALMS|nr:unnamed protein product [Callosobruchus maculatus]
MIASEQTPPHLSHQPALSETCIAMNSMAAITLFTATTMRPSRSLRKRGWPAERSGVATGPYQPAAQGAQGAQGGTQAETGGGATGARHRTAERPGQRGRTSWRGRAQLRMTLFTSRDGWDSSVGWL